MEKTKVATLTLILTLTIAATFAALPIASAHDPPWVVTTYMYMSITPNPIGVGQQSLVVFWLDKVPPTAIGAYGDRWTFTVEVTKPDGTQENLGSFKSDPAGTGYTYYTPDKVGEYTFVAKMDEYTIKGVPAPPGGFVMGVGAYINDTYLGSTSAPYSLIVQEEQIEPLPENSPPTSYWERPINAINRNWYTIAGNWLGGFTVEGPGASRSPLYPDNRFNQYSTGPESAHIVWTRPLWEGGIVDGMFGGASYYSGLSYEQYWGARAGVPIVINGKLYYNVLAPPRYGYYCIDLRTGEELWFHNSTGPLLPTGYRSGGYPLLSFGQVLYFQTPNQYGGFAYLWSAGGTGYYSPPFDTWMMFDAFTGNYICSINNVPRGTRYNLEYGKDGSILVYNIDTEKDRLTIWNTTQTIMYRERLLTTEYWEWRPLLNYTFDGNHGYTLNVSIPEDLTGSILAVLDDRIIGASGLPSEYPMFFAPPGESYTVWCLSLKDGQEGTLLWKKTYTPPPGDLTLAFGVASLEDGVFTIRSKETMQWWGYSLDDGGLLWGPTESQGNWMMFNMNGFVAYGKLIATGGYSAGNEIHAYDIKTGEELWKYYGGSVGLEGWYDNTPISVGAIADGKIYTFSSEHSASMPLRRDAEIRCLDIESGTELWRIAHWGTDGPALADGYLVDANYYDNQIYCYGKGQTATTVSGSPKVSDLGSSVLIEGTVTDQSPGNTCLGIPAAGTPAIADEYITDWMEYLYMQQQCPENAEGVEVIITTFDPNGNTYELGRTTSDIRGTFGISVDPPVPGIYKIIATFQGSDSYYASSAVTYINVEETTSPGQQLEPEMEEPTLAEAPFITNEVIIILAIVIFAVIALAGFYIFRKLK